MTFTKEEFKTKWESENGGGITFNDIADCAVAWGVSSRPMTMPLYKLSNQVLVAAGCEKYFDEDEEI